MNCNLILALENNPEEQKSLHCTENTWTLLPAWKRNTDNLNEVIRSKLLNVFRRRKLN